MKRILTLIPFLILLVACSAPPTSETVQNQPTAATAPANTPQANMPDPASVYCEQQGYRLEIRTKAGGSQSGYCIFPDGSECDEWAYFRGECRLAGQTASPTGISTAMPIDPADYQGWWTYTNKEYGFSIILPEDWTVEDLTTSDPLTNRHMLNLISDRLNIRMTFRRMGENVPLWPTGVGEGEFIEQGTLDVAGQPAQRLLLVCPTGEVTSIWYHDLRGQPSITRGDLEFGFIYSVGNHCELGLSLGGKVQHIGEMIIASLEVP